MAEDKNTIIESKLIIERFANHFSQFVSNRTLDIWTETHQRSKELKELENRKMEIAEMLEETLNEDELILLEQYMELVGRNEVFLRQVIYELGFMDGMQIAARTDNDIINIYPIIK